MIAPALGFIWGTTMVRMMKRRRRRRMTVMLLLLMMMMMFVSQEFLNCTSDVSH
jgi:uncharacterized membrane protein YoaK (UPF0700 family)